MNEMVIKIVLIGDPDIGKSSFLLKYSENDFSDSYVSTIGIDFRIKSVTHKYNNNTYKFKQQIWDTAGQERFVSIISSYYRIAHVVLLFFDLTNFESFKNLNMWISKIREQNNYAPIFLVGTKSDLVSERTVTDNAINDFVKNNIFISEYFEVNARYGDGIKGVFEKVNNTFLDLKRDINYYNFNNFDNDSKKIDITEILNKKDKHGCCYLF
jgi:small GTP-binding protein